MSSNSRIMLFRLLVNLGSCEMAMNTNKIQNKHIKLPILSRPVHWRGWRRRWRAWSPPSTSSPTASPSRGRSARRLPSLALSTFFCWLVWVRSAGRPQKKLFLPPQLIASDATISDNLYFCQKWPILDHWNWYFWCLNKKIWDHYYN